MFELRWFNVELRFLLKRFEFEEAISSAASSLFLQLSLTPLSSFCELLFTLMG